MKKEFNSVESLKILKSIVREFDCLQDSVKESLCKIAYLLSLETAVYRVGDIEHTNDWDLYWVIETTKGVVTAECGESFYLVEVDREYKAELKDWEDMGELRDWDSYYLAVPVDPGFILDWWSTVEKDSDLYKEIAKEIILDEEEYSLMVINLREVQKIQLKSTRSI